MINNIFFVIKWVHDYGSVTFITFQKYSVGVVIKWTKGWDFVFGEIGFK